MGEAVVVILPHYGIPQSQLDLNNLARSLVVDEYGANAQFGAQFVDDGEALSTKFPIRINRKHVWTLQLLGYGQRRLTQKQRQEISAGTKTLADFGSGDISKIKAF